MTKAIHLPVYGTIGTLSNGTLRNEDLIPSFTAELQRLCDTDTAPLDGTGYPELINDALVICDADLAETDENHWDGDDADDVVNRLMDALNAYAPPYCYFGCTDGDGSDFGFWPCLDSFREDFEGIKVSDLADIPDDYCGYAAVVNDHGNVTLYDVTRGKYREIWSIV